MNKLSITALTILAGFTLAHATPNFSFGKAAFKTFVWIKHGDFFSNVKNIEVEMENAGAFRLEVVDKAGKVIGSGDRSNEHGGWSTFSFSAGMDPPVVAGMSPYKLRFVNRAGGARKIKQGQVFQ